MTREILHEIRRFNAGRIPRLVDLKLERMRASSFAFFRGADHLFARAWRDLQFSPAGPPVLSCGDLHLENFGAYRTVDGDFRYDINDFDEAAVVPSDFDLIRFTASVLLAGEEWKLTPLQASRICLAFLDSYRQAVADAVRAGKTGEVGPGSGHGVVEELLEETAQASPQQFLEQFTDKKLGERRITPDPEKRPAVDAVEAKIVRKAIESFGKQIGKPDAYRVQDVRGRVAGIGSLGVSRFLVLIKGEGTSGQNRLLDVKAVLPSAVVDSSPCLQPAWMSDADRVVASQFQLQARPAGQLAALDIEGRPFRIREMVPEENRSKLDRFQRKPEKLRSAVETAAHLTAWAHLRGSAPAGHDTLSEWSAARGTDAVLTAAMRIAQLTEQQYLEFCAAT